MSGAFTTASARDDARWPVMVLAHNEERHIVGCLDSLFEGELGLRLEVFVMANGCTDSTEELTKAYARRRPEVRLVSIPLGDKCNAWNVFIHEIVPTKCPARPIYFFMDGDARVVPGSLRTMAATLRADTYAHAVSAPPASGRNVARDRKALLKNRGLVANLYALRGSVVRRLLDMDVRLPLKLEGDDGLLGVLIKWDLDPKHKRIDHRRITPCPDAGFEFESISPFAPASWLVYWRRAVRYGRSRYEFELLGKRLKQRGIAGLPKDITEIYADAGRLRLRWNGLYTLANWFALREITRIGHEAGTTTRASQPGPRS